LELQRTAFGNLVQWMSTVFLEGLANHFDPDIGFPCDCLYPSRPAVNAMILSIAHLMGSSFHILFQPPALDEFAIVVAACPERTF